MAEYTCQYIARNLKAKNLGPLSKFGSTTSVNTVEESETKEEKIEPFIMQAETPKSDILRNLPKYTPDSISFAAYRRKIDAFFKWCNLTDGTKKLELVEYAVSEYDSEALLFADIVRVEGNDDYKKVLDQSVACVDGTITHTKAELTCQAFQIKLINYRGAKEYHSAFVNLRAKNSSLEEEVLVEAFVKGIHIANIQNIIKNNNKRLLQANVQPTLYQNYVDLEGMYSQKQSIEVNQSQISANYGKNKNFSKNYNNNYNQPQKTTHINNQSNSNGNYKKNKKKIRCWTCGKRGHDKYECRNRQKIRAFLATLDEDDEQDGGPDRGQENVENFEIPNNFAKDCVFGGIENIKNSDLAQDSSCAKIVSSEKTPGHFNDTISERMASNLAEQANFGDSKELGIVEQSKCVNLMDYHVNFQYHKLIQRKFILKGQGGDISWNPYIDTGAQRSVMSKNTAEQAGLHIHTDVDFRVFGFDRKASNLVYGYVKDAKIVIPGTSKILNFSPIIMSDPKANLCGLDILWPSGGGELVSTENTGDGRYVFNSERVSITSVLESFQAKKFV